jgi:hypothetical protein
MIRALKIRAHLYQSRLDLISVLLCDEPGASAKNLPPELIQHIAKFLDVKSVNNFARTSKYMNNVLNDISLWKCIYHIDTIQISEQCQIEMQKQFPSPFFRKIEWIRELTIMWVSYKLRQSKLLDVRLSNWKTFYKSVNNEIKDWLEFAKYGRTRLERTLRQR